MGGRRRALATLLALAAAALAVPAVAAATVPTAHAAPGPTARATAQAVAPAPFRHPAAAATPAPTATPIPLHTPGDPSAAVRRRLQTRNSVEEGFLLGLPGAGPRGPTEYLPPQPRSATGDGASLLLAALAGLLAAVGSGACLLYLVLSPRSATASPAARVSVSLAPAQAHRRWSPVRRQRTTRLSQEVFERLPPLLQLAVLDRARPPADAPEDAAAPAPPPPG